MSATDFLILVTGYAGVLIVSGFAVAVLWQIYKGEINLARLVSEADGSASMSRFQFLVFTFVIGFSLILVVVATMGGDSPTLPQVPGGVMALLGISGGTYAVSKGIQNSNANSTESTESTGSKEPK